MWKLLSYLQTHISWSLAIICIRRLLTLISWVGVRCWLISLDIFQWLFNSDPSKQTPFIKCLFICFWYLKLLLGRFRLWLNKRFLRLNYDLLIILRLFDSEWLGTFVIIYWEVHSCLIVVIICLWCVKLLFFGAH